jgi:hypothetical protein
MLTSNKLKCTLVLKGEELLTIPAPEGQPRVTLRVKLPDRTISADIATKSLRRAQTAIRELGADGVAVNLQGVLQANDVLADAGLAAQPRAEEEAA